jgi:hypothetical protein
MSFRTVLLAGGRVLAFLVAAVGVAVDATGVSAGNTDAIRITIYVSGALFVALTLWREIEIRLMPRPKVTFKRFSPHTRPVGMFSRATGELLKQRDGHFVRIAFANEATDPSGDSSIAHRLCAQVRVIDMDGQEVDCWTGRWAVLEEPRTPARKWEVDAIDLGPNGQEAILDIGVRYEDEKVFYGWDNNLMIGSENRPPLPRQRYEIEVTLRANNMRAVGPLRFLLDNPPDGTPELSPKEQ